MIEPIHYKSNILFFCDVTKNQYKRVVFKDVFSANVSYDFLIRR